MTDRAEELEQALRAIVAASFTSRVALDEAINRARSLIAPWTVTAITGRWRVGRKVPRNIYLEDEPIAMMKSSEIAAAIVVSLNLAESLLATEPWCNESAVQALRASLARAFPT